MNNNELQNHLLTNSLEDQWYLSMEGVVEESPLTLNEIEEILTSDYANNYSDVKVLHATQTGAQYPAWVDYETPHTPHTYHQADLDITKDDALGPALLMIPLLGGLAIFIICGSMSLFDGVTTMFNILAFSTIIICGIFVYFDALRLNIGQRKIKGKIESGPGVWTIAIWLMFILCYPMYIYHRSKYGARNYLAVGLLSMLFYLFGLFVIGSAIETQKESVRSSLQRIEQIAPRFNAIQQPRRTIIQDYE